jgi:HEPN domain-containing protein
MSTKSGKKQKTAWDCIRDISPNEIDLMADNFHKLAYGDYIAARTLLINNLPLQGLVFASTTVEKYLKALLILKGKILRDHITKEFLSAIRSFYKDYELNVNESFVDYLGRSYAFRYIEANSGPASITVEVRKLLAELDASVKRFETDLLSLRLEKNVGRYFNDFNLKDDRVIRENYLYESKNISEFIRKPGMLYFVVLRPMQLPFTWAINDFQSEDNRNFDFPKLEFSGPETLNCTFSSPEETKRFGQLVEVIMAHEDIEGLNESMRRHQTPDFVPQVVKFDSD